MSEQTGDAYRLAVGETIRRLRGERGWSLGALGQRTGRSISYLSELEHGLKEPSGASLEALAAAFGLTLAELLGAVTQALQPGPALPPRVLRGLGEPELAELSRYADWLRWRGERERFDGPRRGVE
ncbi:MAG TPA: helix-turn-helix transcriptional regulator [Thermomicrobiaceae bacterium]|nr:helix-turn-helix transcriptional regulator [Thermomicrobiaceae bacterium]